MQILDINTIKNIKDYKERKEINEIIDYINNNDDKIKIISGLRRVGKTTLMFQVYNKIINKNPIFIQIENGDKVEDLCKLLDKYNGRYIFIDEITFIENPFNINILYDKYSKMGKKIIISGTYSAMFNTLLNSALYDRANIMNVEPLSFLEYQRVLNNNNVDSYIENNGLFSNFYDSDKIINSITDNILNSLKKTEISEIYTENTIKSIIMMCFIKIIWTEDINEFGEFKPLGIKNKNIKEINKYLESIIKNLDPYIEYTQIRDIELIFNQLIKLNIIKIQNNLIDDSKSKKLITIPGILEYIYRNIINFCENNNIFYSKRLIKGKLFEKNMNIQSYLANKNILRYNIDLVDCEFDEIIDIDNKLIVIDYKVSDDLELIYSRIKYNKIQDSLNKLIKNKEYEYRIIYKGETEIKDNIKFQNYIEFLKEIENYKDKSNKLNIINLNWE